MTWACCCPSHERRSRPRPASGRQAGLTRGPCVCDCASEFPLPALRKNQPLRFAAPSPTLPSRGRLRGPSPSPKDPRLDTTESRSARGCFWGKHDSGVCSLNHRPCTRDTNCSEGSCRCEFSQEKILDQNASLPFIFSGHLPIRMLSVFQGMRGHLVC